MLPEVLVRPHVPVLVLLVASCAPPDDEGPCVTERRGITEAAGTVSLRFVARDCDDPARCWGAGCGWVDGGESFEVECRLPVAGVGTVNVGPPAGGCDVVAWDDRRVPGEPMPVFLALRCRDPGPYLFFGLPDLRTLDMDWPLTLPLVSNAEPYSADGPAIMNWWSRDGIRRCSVGSDDPSRLEGLIELVNTTGPSSPGAPTQPDFRVSVRVDGHVPLRVGLEGRAAVPCTQLLGLDFDLNLIQTAADYDHCE